MEENEATVIGALREVLNSGKDENEVLVGIAEIKKDVRNGRLLGQIEQIEASWGKSILPEYEFVDLCPELPIEDKRGRIKKLLEEKIKGNTTFDEIKFFDQVRRQIKFKEEWINIEKVYENGWGFILYKSTDDPFYYLDVLKNHSFVQWTELFKLTKSQGEEFLANPSYEKAMGNAAIPEKPSPTIRL